MYTNPVNERDHERRGAALDPCREERLRPQRAQRLEGQVRRLGGVRRVERRPGVIVEIPGERGALPRATGLPPP
jgi:hypothetical protein